MSAPFQVSLRSNSNVYLTPWHRVYVQGGLVSKSEMKGAKNLIFTFSFFFMLHFLVACCLGKMLKDQSLRDPAAHPGWDGAMCHPSTGAVANSNLTASTPRSQCSQPWSVFSFLKIPNIPREVTHQSPPWQGPDPSCLPAVEGRGHREMEHRRVQYPPGRMPLCFPWILKREHKAFASTPEVPKPGSLQLWLPRIMLARHLFGQAADMTSSSNPQPLGWRWERQGWSWIFIVAIVRQL